MTKIPELEALACAYVGSNRTPVLYFVTLEGVVQTVTTDPIIASQAAEAYGEGRSVIIEKSDYGVWWQNRRDQDQGYSEEEGLR